MLRYIQQIAASFVSLWSKMMRREYKNSFGHETQKNDLKDALKVRLPVIHCCPLTKTHDSIL